MAMAKTDRTKAVKASVAAAPMGTAAVLGRYLARIRKPSGTARVPVAAPRPTPERAISTAIGRAAQKTCALSSFPVQARMGQTTLAELTELLPDRALILVVENYLGSHGVVALSSGFLSSIIEMQSMGRVFSHAVSDRRPTRTDAAISAEFVNAALAELASEFNAFGTGGGLAAFRFASFVEDPKPLELMLEDTVYHSFRLDTRLGQGGARDGQFLAFLPGNEIDAANLLPASTVGAVPVTGVPRTLAEAVRAAPITMNAVLCRKKISLRELRGLVPGAVITLPFDAMARTRLETASGLLVAGGKLGALHGQRAVRIAGANPPVQTAAAPPSEPESAVGWTTDNLFGDPGDANIPGHASLFADEPPLGDISTPDAFRPGPASDDVMPQSALALPMNFIVE